MENGFDVLSTATNLQVASRGGTYKVVSDVPVSVAARGARYYALHAYSTALTSCAFMRLQIFETRRPRTMSQSAGTRYHLKMPMKTWAESLSKNWSRPVARTCPVLRVSRPSLSVDLLVLRTAIASPVWRGGIYCDA